MAVYPAAVKRLIPPSTTDPRITPRVAILHVDAGGADGEALARYFNGPSGGIESHFHIEYDGTVYQYRDTAYEADANWHANPFAVSIETQGKAEGEWTAAQLASIKALLLWLHATHGIPLTVPARWDGSGVGYHILHMDEWAGGPRACPGPDRIRQFHNQLVPWMTAGATLTPPEEDFMDVKNPVTGEPWPAEKALWSIWTYALNASRDAAVARKLAEAQAKAARPLTAAEIDDIAKATVSAMGADYNAQITLTPKES